MDIKALEVLLDIPSLEVTSVEADKKTICVNCTLKEHQGNCPQCGKALSKVHQYSKREVRDLDISGRKVLLNIRVAQLVCEDCKRYFNERLDFVEPNKGYTKRHTHLCSFYFFSFPYLKKSAKFVKKSDDRFNKRRVSLEIERVL